MPTTSNGDCCVELMKGTLVRPLARYPGSIAVDDPLKVAENQTRTSLVRNVSTGDTMFTVSDASRLVPQVLLSVDSEIVSVSAIDYTNNVLTVIRGFDGTFPACHSAGSILSANIVAWHHNVLAAEITAIETALGPNLSNITGASDSGTISTKYDFAAQQPGGNLIAGLNVVTLTPVPQGVHGANADHYLYVSGGTGAAEACLISGGTAVGGAASGTVFLNCGNAHTGPWQIRSATAGIQESIYSVGPSGDRVNVKLPPSDSITHAPITVDGDYVCLYGEGESSAIVPQFGSQFPNTAAVRFNALGNLNQTGWYNTLRNIRIAGPGGATTLTGIQIRGQLGLRIYDAVIEKTKRGIYLYELDGSGATSSAVWIQNTMLMNIIPGGIAFEQAGGADLFFSHNHLTSDPANPAMAGILLTYSLGSKFLWNEVYGFNYAIAMQPTAGLFVSAVESIANWYDSSQIDGVRIFPQGTGTVSEVRFIADRIAAAQQNGVGILGTAANVLGIVFSDDIISHNHGQGIYYGGGMDVEFNGCHVCSNSAGSPGTAHGLFVAAGASNFRVHGGTYAQAFALPGSAPPNTQGFGILISAGASDNFILEGAVVMPNVAGGVADGSTGQNKILRNLLGMQKDIGTATVTGSTIDLSTQPYESYLVAGTATINNITPAWPGRSVILYKNDGGAITFTTAGNIANVVAMSGSSAPVKAEFIGTKWVLFAP